MSTKTGAYSRNSNTRKLTNRDIQNSAARQSAYDCSCAPEYRRRGIASLVGIFFLSLFF